MALLRRVASLVVLTVAVLAAGSAVAGVLTRFQVQLADNFLLAVIGAQALNLLLGYAGLVSVGNTAFLAIGGYAAVSVTVFGGWPWGAGVVAAFLAAAAVGVVVGALALRLHGLYLALATIALHFIVLAFAQEYHLRFGGTAHVAFAMPASRLGPWRLDGAAQWLPVLLVAVVLVTLVIRNLADSRTGRALMAVRDREAAAALLGIPVTRYKVLAFALSSALIGLQGALWAYSAQSVFVDLYPLSLSIAYLTMVVVGGRGSIGGPILGAALITVLPFATAALTGLLPPTLSLVQRFSIAIYNVNEVLYGLVLLACLHFEPRGLWHLLSRAAKAVRSFPLASPVSGLWEEVTGQ